MKELAVVYVDCRPACVVPDPFEVMSHLKGENYMSILETAAVVPWQKKNNMKNVLETAAVVPGKKYNNLRNIFEIEAVVP